MKWYDLNLLTQYAAVLIHTLGNATTATSSGVRLGLYACVHMFY